MRSPRYTCSAPKVTSGCCADVEGASTIDHTALAGPGAAAVADRHVLTLVKESFGYVWSCSIIADATMSGASMIGKWRPVSTLRIDLMFANLPS